MVPNLPGFYYDRERRRYFRISDSRTVHTTGTTTQYTEENIKRQRVQAGFDKQLSVVKDRRQHTLERYKVGLLNPLQRAFRPLPYRKYVDGLRLQYAYHSHSKDNQSHRPVSAELLHVPNRMQIGTLADYALLFAKEGPLQDKIVFATTNGYVAGFSSLTDYSEESFFTTFSMSAFNPALRYKSEPTDVFKTMKLERTISTQKGPDHYLYHNINGRSNVHTFVILMQDIFSLKVLKVCQVKLRENDQVHDSLVVGDTLIISVNDCCHFYNMVPEVFPEPFIFFPGNSSRKSKNTRSDITSISFSFQEDTFAPQSKLLNSGVFYVGFRNGDSVATILKDIGNMTLSKYFEVNKKTLKKQNISIKTTLKSIVSIKPLNNKGLIVISGMADRESTQQLIIVDTFLEEALTKKVTVSFRTKFLNVTKNTELLKVSDDGYYFIYGSTSARNGKGDFEVFYTSLSGNLDYEKSANGNITMYPMRDMGDYFQTEGFDPGHIHLHSAFIPPRYSKMSNTIETTTRPACVSSHDISEDVFSGRISFLIRREDSPFNGANFLVTSSLA
ncbi:YGL176C [Saccharomyces arboricola H-6]|uniref:YGL176C n=1 Tax=Saccharomyces arboricola (strain H-6 / AS 2.3317 / CBS 10644) TaxID=1160507 RepID=J8Q5A7_SACAR|nr:YGL176C [Saccharomyces arboricola H-6]